MDPKIGGLILILCCCLCCCCIIPSFSTILTTLGLIPGTSAHYNKTSGITIVMDDHGDTITSANETGEEPENVDEICDSIETNVDYDPEVTGVEDGTTLSLSFSSIATTDTNGNVHQTGYHYELDTFGNEYCSRYSS